MEVCVQFYPPFLSKISIEWIKINREKKTHSLRSVDTSDMVTKLKGGEGDHEDGKGKESG